MKKTVKALMSIYVMVGTLFIVIAAYTILIFTYVYPPARPTEIYDHVLFVLCSGVIPTLIIILAIPRGIFSVVTISEMGVKRTLFAKLCKREIRWEEMSEIRYYPRIMPFVFFVKNGSLEGLSYESIIKRKDVIQVALSKKVYNAIKQFTDKEIVNLPENFEKR